MARSTDEFGASKSRPVGIVEAPPERQRGSGNRQRKVSRRAGRRLIWPTVTLGLWRLRKTWGLLLITGIGIVAAVMLVCTVPLFSEIAMTAGLRGVLTSPSNNPSIYVYSASTRISAQIINQTTQSLNQDFQKNLGHYLAPPQFSLQPQPFPILGKPAQSSRTSASQLRPTGNLVKLISASMDAVPSHLRLIAGRLPRTNSSDIEIAITPESAAQLQMTVGSVIPVIIPFVDANQVTTERVLNLHLVGLFRFDSTSYPFWDGSDFHNTSPDCTHVADTIPALVSVETSLSVFTKISDEAASQGQFFAGEAPFFLSYHL